MEQNLPDILRDYEVIENIEDAGYWIAYPDDRPERAFLKELITPYKIYKLEILKEKIIDVYGEEVEDEEYFFKDNSGQYCMDYMIHKGDFLRKI